MGLSKRYSEYACQKQGQVADSAIRQYDRPLSKEHPPDSGVTVYSVAAEGQMTGASYGSLRLGWPQFWLLIAILGGMLALVAFVLFAIASSL
jgi:hypothetical protein